MIEEIDRFWIGDRGAVAHRPTAITGPPEDASPMPGNAIDGLFIRKAKPCRGYICEPRPRISLDALSGVAIMAAVSGFERCQLPDRWGRLQVFHVRILVR